MTLIHVRNRPLALQFDREKHHSQTRKLRLPGVLRFLGERDGFNELLPYIVNRSEQIGFEGQVTDSDQLHHEQ